MEHRSRGILVSILCVGLASASVAQDAAGWGDLDRIIMPALTNSGTAAASFWLPNAASPARATEAVAVVYEHIPGSAGSTSIAIGVFRRGDGGFALAGRVDGIYGATPRDVAFYPDRIEFTTSTLNEGDPRCCPSGSTRWAIDRATLASRAVE